MWERAYHSAVLGTCQKNHKHPFPRIFYLAEFVEYFKQTFLQLLYFFSYYLKFKIKSDITLLLFSLKYQ